MYAEPMEREAEILYPAKLNKSALRDAIRHIEANGDGALARVLVALLGETQRAEAAQQRCAELEREVHRLANWMQGAACRLAELEGHGAEFMDGVEPVGYRPTITTVARKLVETRPDYPHEQERESRKEPVLIYLRKAEPSPLPFVHMRDLDGPRTDSGNRTVCTYPCYKCDPEAFTNEWAENEAKRLNVRMEA